MTENLVCSGFMVQRHNEAHWGWKNPHRTHREHIQAGHHKSDGERLRKIFLQSFQPFREGNQPSCAPNRFKDLSLEFEQNNGLSVQTLKFPISGAPSVPILTGSPSSSHLYSYDLVWEVKSEYNIKHHEAVFWPASQVRIGTNIKETTKWELGNTKFSFLFEFYFYQDCVLFFPAINALQRGPSKLWSTYHFQDALFDIPPKGSQSKRIPSLPKSEEYNYNLKGLQNNTYYNVVIRAQNKFGWSPYSDVFTFQTLEKDKATMKLQNQQVIPIFEGQGKKQFAVILSNSIKRNEWCCLSCENDFPL